MTDLPWDQLYVTIIPIRTYTVHRDYQENELR